MITGLILFGKLTYNIKGEAYYSRSLSSTGYKTVCVVEKVVKRSQPFLTMC